MTESEAIKICNTIGFATSFSNPQGIPLNTTKDELMEAIRMSIQALEKQMPKKPNHKYIKYGRHKWKKDEDGKIDDWAWEYEFCNGVVCERCGESICVHCNPDYDKLDDCEANIYSCPFCDKKVGYRQKYCDCGQAIDWSDEE